MPESDPAFSDCRGCICSAMRRAVRTITQHYEASFRGAGLRATQFTVLATLTQTGPLTVSRLAALLGVERTTLTRNLRPLQSRGWIRTSSDVTDQRLRRIELAPKGRRAALKALPAWRRAQESARPVLDRLGVQLSRPRETT